MDNNHTHNEYPFIGLLLTVFSIVTNYSVDGLDKTVLTPIAHLISIGSGSCAITLFMITIWERYIRKK